MYAVKGNENRKALRGKIVEKICKKNTKNMK